MSPPRLPTAILISGRGSNMASLIQAAADPAYPADIRLVLSNNPDAPGLQTARLAGIPAIAIDHRPYGKNREAHERALQSALEDHGIQAICLAGYMRVLTPYLVRTWQGKMLNIHPSLLPALPGLNTHARALAEHHTEHGCTIHLVTEKLDEGPILAQARVPVLPTDTEESLAARVLAQEHRLYPAALATYAQTRDAKE